MFCGLSGQLVMVALNIFWTNMQWLVSLTYNFWDFETGWNRCRTNSYGKLCPLGPLLCGGSVDFHAGSNPE